MSELGEKMRCSQLCLEPGYGPSCYHSGINYTSLPNFSQIKNLLVHNHQVLEYFCNTQKWLKVIKIESKYAEISIFP